MSNIRQRRDSTPPSFAPEFRLLAACTLRPASERLASWRDQVAALVCQVTDWSALLALVRRHQVYGLVYQALSDLPDGVSVPREIIDKLAAMARRSRLDGLFRLAETRKIAKLFQGSGIPAVQLKGAPLSQRLYGDPLMRHSMDIDVLVPLAGLGDAVQLLDALGFATQERMPLMSGLRGQMQRRAYHHCMLHNGANVHLELHWRLGTFSEAESNRVLDDSLADATTGLRVLPQAFEMTYLIAHGTRHYWERLKWLSDIKQALLTIPPALWGDFAQQALAGGVQHAVELTRCVLAWVFDTPGAELPRCTPQDQDRHVRSAKYALHRIQGPLERHHSVRSVLDRALYRLDCSTPYEKFSSALRLVTAGNS